VVANAQTAVASAPMAETDRPCRSTRATTEFVAGSIRWSTPVEATHTASSVAAICLRYGVIRTGISVRTSFVWRSIRATAPDSPLRCNPTHADSAPTATPPIGWSTSGSASGMLAVIRGSPVSEGIGLGCPEGVSSAAGVGSGRKAPMANAIAEVASRSAEVATTSRRAGVGSGCRRAPCSSSTSPGDS
jgi:hypothetical protein